MSAHDLRNAGDLSAFRFEDRTARGQRNPLEAPIAVNVTGD
ncbi:hypothetical protein [Actinomadura citrea]|uniref:Uncharacterized protein n=1 Tax=Actinomadura citrea TaxID=46158 RepID=A0A7Y9KET9_9ACTN|nr:hypothetical protein [Actinomadura citrea]NYE14875.1 hypothetical protein [Actinomadura citrea]